jgi:hypothetical protein
MPIAMQRVAKQIPGTNPSTARQRRGKHVFATVEEVMSSMGQHRDYISTLLQS